MSKKSLSQSKSVADTKVARKRYEAPVLEAYGTVQELTLTSYYPSGTDAGIYSSSAPA